MPPEERVTLRVDADAVRRMAATLDRPVAPAPGDPLPLLWHWLLLLPDARTDQLDVDGHPHTGDLIPDVGLPQRMWAGSRVHVSAPLRVGETVERHSTVHSVQHKEGRSGKLAFVTLRHAYLAQGQEKLVEEQDLVYRERPAAEVAPKEPRRPEGRGQFSRTVRPHAALLFRYSAITFNAHRIHYDRDYAMKQEGYPGLVVQGPLTATLLAGLFEKHEPRARVTSLSFRAEAPLFDTAPFSLHGRRDGTKTQLWAQAPAGGIAMSMEIEST